jgi:hypothetical protein
MTLHTLRSVLLALSRTQAHHAPFLGLLLDALDKYEIEIKKIAERS